MSPHSRHCKCRKSLWSFFPHFLLWVPLPDYQQKINKSQAVRGSRKQPAGSISPLHSASVLGDLMRLDKPVAAWGAGISCLGSGIIHISLQNDAPNPTSHVHHEGRCPQHSECIKPFSDDVGDLTWYSTQKRYLICVFKLEELLCWNVEGCGSL